MNGSDCVWSCKDGGGKLANPSTEKTKQNKKVAVEYIKRGSRVFHEARVFHETCSHLVVPCVPLPPLQDSETLLSLSRSEGGAISLSLGKKTKSLPSSPFLLIHFHGGGFVAQTSKSHEVGTCRARLQSKSDPCCEISRGLPANQVASSLRLFL